MKECKTARTYIIPLCIIFLFVQTASICGLFFVSFSSIEKYVVKKNIYICTSALNAELKRIDAIAYEWGVWDDAAAFIKGKTPKFIEENLSDNALQKKNIDIVCFIDLQGNITWSRAIRPADSDTLAADLSTLMSDELRKNTALWTHNDINSFLSGFYPTEAGVLMLSSYPVTNNAGTGPICGTVIMGRFVSDELISNVARQTCIDFKWWNLKSEYTRYAMDHYVSRLLHESPILVESDAGLQSAYTLLPGIQAEPTILVKFVITDELIPYKGHFLAASIIIYLVEGFIFLAILALVVHKRCRAHYVQTKRTARNAVNRKFAYAANPLDAGLTGTCDIDSHDADIHEPVNVE